MLVEYPGSREKNLLQILNLINQSMTMSALGDKWEVIGELDEALQTSFARSAKREQLELHPTPQ